MQKFSGDPYYQEFTIPRPPPLPNHFPNRQHESSFYPSGTGIEESNGYVEMSQLDKQTHFELSSKLSIVNIRYKPTYLETNPIYDSSDSFSDGRCENRNREIFSSRDENELNLYAELPHTICCSISKHLEEPVHIEADFELTVITNSSTNSQLAQTEVMPCVSIYDNPKPLLRSEGPTEIGIENVREVKDLGMGQFGQVVLAETLGLSLKDLHLDEKDDNKDVTVQVALKRLKSSTEQHVKESFEKEVKFMSRLCNKNVIRLLAICSSNNPFIVLEYMSQGDLNQFLQSRVLASGGDRPCTKDCISSSELVFISLQIASGMKYLSSLRFIHRDLATRNCLVGDDLEVKIADFGMSCSLYSSSYYRISGRAMLPIRWMANECFYGKFSEKTDVWAFGVTMWEVFNIAKEQPYHNMADQEVIDDAIKGPHRKLLPQPDFCSEEVYKVMNRCWFDEPSERAKFCEVHSLLEAIYEGKYD